MEQRKLAPGRELDALVAENVMGWPVFDCPMAHTFPHVVFDGLDVVLFRSKDQVGENWEPSTSIEEAWQVVDRLCSSFYLRWDDSACLWFADMDQKRRIAEDCRGRAYADTAPHAICLAALKAVGYNG